ncbi:hypothetical protein [Microbacterium sp. KR10-403]|uniref:hypothetical protein n=1 Tax=Microbacterium sp. KR10-403 TaxID=3158581 RepID=UPI0032E469FC
MAKYHVTKSGRTEPCTATVRACPLGEANHFASAQEAIQASMAETPKEVDTSDLLQESVKQFCAEAEKREVIEEDGSAVVTIPGTWRWQSEDGPRESDFAEFKVGRRQNPQSVWNKFVKDGVVTVKRYRGDHGTTTELTPELEASVSAYFTGLKERIGLMRTGQEIFAELGVSQAQLEKKAKEKHLRDASESTKVKYAAEGWKVTTSQENQFVFLVEGEVVGTDGKSHKLAAVMNTTGTYTRSQPVVGKHTEKILQKHPSLKAEQLELLRHEVWRDRARLDKLVLDWRKRRDPAINDLPKETIQELIHFYNTTRLA